MADGILFSKDHEWITTKGNVAYIGISTYAQSSLGDLVYIELPSKDTKVKQGDEIGVVESVKVASEIYTPVSGTIIAVNEALEENVDLLKSSEQEGWIVQIEMEDKAELDTLLDETSYTKFLESDEV